MRLVSFVKKSFSFPAQRILYLHNAQFTLVVTEWRNHGVCEQAKNRHAQKTSNSKRSQPLKFYTPLV
jgi:hypothetical protein